METSVSRKAPPPPPPPAPLSVRCPECGAANPTAADWCGQCFARFQREEDVVAPSLSDARAPAVSAPPPPPLKKGPVGSGDGTFVVTDDGLSWNCKKCDSPNEFDSNVCSVCGTSFAEAIKPPEDPKPVRDANMTALVSLFLPGAGHAYIGMWGQAVARAIISLWVVSVAIFSAAQSATSARIMGLLFGVIAVGLWVVAAHDAFREAQNSSGRVILKQRYFLYVVLGILMLSVVMVFTAAVGARG